MASAALLVVMTPQMVSLTGMSREAADWRCADGVRAVIDSLRPGVSVVLSFSAWPWKDPVHLSGNEVSVEYGNGTVRLPLEWAAPVLTLEPSTPYRVWLLGGQVQVLPLG